jgi:hypothetical protein
MQSSTITSSKGNPFASSQGATTLSVNELLPMVLTFNAGATSQTYQQLV